jgi:uncharacterized protein
MAMPSFHVTEIPEEGLNFSCEVQPDELSLTAEEKVLHMSVSANIIKTGTRIDVTGVLAGTFLRQCVRCLKEYEEMAELPLAAEYRHTETPMRHAAKPAKESRRAPEREEPVEETEFDEDVYACSGDRLDLSEMLREQVILATPMQPLCHEQCPGLCPVCGRDRNEGDCGCIEESPENPFAVLRKLQKQPGDGRMQGRTRTGSKSQRI